MSITVKLFGDLRKKCSNDVTGGIPSLVTINNKGLATISDLLEYLNIKQSETSHIFVNGSYSGFSKKIKDGDCIGLFPRNMGLLYKWYFHKEEDDDPEDQYHH
jgi:molybdopterin converting factor small subunit